MYIVLYLFHLSVYSYYREKLFCLCSFFVDFISLLRWQWQVWSVSHASKAPLNQTEFINTSIFRFVSIVSIKSWIKKKKNNKAESFLLGGQHFPQMVLGI